MLWHEQRSAGNRIMNISQKQWELMREICRADFNECWAWTGKKFEQHWPIPEKPSQYTEPQSWIGRGLAISKHLMKIYNITQADHKE